MLSLRDGAGLTSLSPVVPTERFLDFSPTGGKVSVALWLGPNQMKMIRKQDNCVNLKWAAASGLIDGMPENFTSQGVGKNGVASVSHDREEKRSPRLV